MFMTLSEQNCRHDAEEYSMEELGCTEFCIQSQKLHVYGSLCSQSCGAR